MPIYHHDTDKVRDTPDIQVEGVAPMNRVIEGGTEKVIWDRVKHPVGYWGVLITTAPNGTNFHPVFPTSEQLAAIMPSLNSLVTLPHDFNAKHEDVPSPVSTPMKGFITIPRINADDWAATGTTATIWEATGRYFVLIREDVGQIADIVNATGIPQMNDFTAYNNLVIDGVTYNGWINVREITIFDGSLHYAVRMA